MLYTPLDPLGPNKLSPDLHPEAQDLARTGKIFFAVTSLTNKVRTLQKLTVAKLGGCIMCACVCVCATLMSDKNVILFVHHDAVFGDFKTRENNGLCKFHSFPGD